MEIKIKELKNNMAASIVSYNNQETPLAQRSKDTYIRGDPNTCVHA